MKSNRGDRHSPPVEIMSYLQPFSGERLLISRWSILKFCIFSKKAVLRKAFDTFFLAFLGFPIFISIPSEFCVAIGSVWLRLSQSLPAALLLLVIYFLFMLFFGRLSACAHMCSIFFCISLFLKVRPQGRQGGWLTWWAPVEWVNPRPYFYAPRSAGRWQPEQPRAPTSTSNPRCRPPPSSGTFSDMHMR